jgi:hypothetical protein
MLHFLEEDFEAGTGSLLIIQYMQREEDMDYCLIQLFISFI